MRLRRLLTLARAAALVLVLALGAPPVTAQGAADREAGESLAWLSRRADDAQWLARYDRVAWLTSDLLIALPDSARQGLGPAWFCLPVDGQWHAVYGRFEPANDAFVSVVHFAPDSGGQFRVAPPLDPERTTPLARALAVTRAQLPAEIANGRVRFNQYVRRNDDGSLEVWYVPAWQPNGIIVYGGDLHFVLSGDGRTVTRAANNLGALRGLRPDTTIDARLLQEDRPLPSVGNLLALLLYRSQFKSMHIISGRFVTGTMQTDDGLILMSAVREDRVPPDTTIGGD